MLSNMAGTTTYRYFSSDMCIADIIDTQTSEQSISDRTSIELMECPSCQINFSLVNKTFRVAEYSYQDLGKFTRIDQILEIILLWPEEARPKDDG